MSNEPMELVHRALATVLGEILDGSAADSGWLLNPKDPGLLQSLARLSAADASAPSADDGPSIAAHVDHLRYGLQLLSRWGLGESPFDDADWNASWRIKRVSSEEWQELLGALRQEAQRWQGGFGSLVQAGETGLTGAIASAAHLAYHLGAIRQIQGATRGPAERPQAETE